MIDPRHMSEENYKELSDGLMEGKSVDQIKFSLPKMKRLKNNNEESRSQKALITWWKSACNKYAIPEELLFAIPNGMAFGGKAEWQVKTSIIRGKNAKLEGLRPGICDLMLATPKYRGVARKDELWDHGLFIEMKTAAGVVSPEQKLIHSFLTARGYKVVVCRSTEEAIKEIETYLS